jgi:c-di-GMP-binding flagellar brake protein YcgR
MAMLQELDNAQIDQAIDAAAQRNVPVILTIHQDNEWLNLHSRLVQVRSGHVQLALPLGENGQAPHEFVPAEKVGVSFKLKHYKHVFTAVVAGIEQVSLEDGATIPTLSICSPTHMQRIQRRAFLRADVPANRIVRATFWLGGREAEPIGPSEDRPVWFGKVANISAGGFQLRTGCDLADALETGESVGVRISFGAGANESVFSDAQFRHAESCDGGLMLGFQFVGLDQTPAGRQALQTISSKVSEFHRAMDQAQWRQGSTRQFAAAGRPTASPSRQDDPDSIE